MKTAVSLLLALACLPLAHARERTALDQHAAGDRASMGYARLRDWEPSGPAQLVLWGDRRERPWLLDVAPPCRALVDARTLGITSAGRRIVIGIDEVVANGQRCRVQRVRPLDPRAVAAWLPPEREPRRVFERPRAPSDRIGPRPRGPG